MSATEEEKKSEPMDGLTERTKNTAISTTKVGEPSSSSPSREEQQQMTRDKKMQELEAKAVDRAKATADAAFRPSSTVMNAQSAQVLLDQVDGPHSLATYENKESVYIGRSVPIGAGGKLNIPIQVTTPGSVVEYSVELRGYDISFAITAEREEGVTIVKDASRVDVSQCPITQKFLVGTVPCLLQFKFDNEYSWVREKVVSYKITVTPPSRESLAAGRRRRAQACLKAVEDDLKIASQRLSVATRQKSGLHEEVAKLMHELAEKKKAWQVAEKEEAWLKERKALRVEQQKLLLQRLNHGWDDEKDLPKDNDNSSTPNTDRK